MSKISEIIESIQTDFYQATGRFLCQRTQFERITELNNFCVTGVWGQTDRFRNSQEDDGSVLYDELYSKYSNALYKNKKLVEELQRHGIDTSAFTLTQDDRTDEDYLRCMKRIFIAISELFKDVVDDSARTQLYNKFNNYFFKNTSTERFMFNANDDPSLPLECVTGVQTWTHVDDASAYFSHQAVLFESLEAISDRLQYLLDLLINNLR